MSSRLTARVAVLIGTCALSIACSGPARLDAGFETSLTTVGFCSDFFVAHDSADTILLVFKDAGGAYGENETRNFDFAATSSDGVLYVETGEALAAGFCGSTPNTNTQTEARYHAVSGTAQVSTGGATTITGGGTGVIATITLGSVSLSIEPDGSHQVDVASHQLSGFELPL